MSHLAPRPPQRPAHQRTRSNSQPPDQRLEVVGRLEGCIRDVLEATKAYKSPQQQTAHQNANQMFQQKVMASQGHMGNISEHDWLGTMMQCLNESMRTQQSLFVRNTTLDVALRTFASGVFDALGPAFFQEPFDKYMAASKPSAPRNAAASHHAALNSGILSPPRELGPSQPLMQPHGSHNMPPPPSRPPHFPSAHHQLAQRPAPGARPVAVAVPQHQLHGMPIIQQPLPPTPRRPGRPPKRPSPSEISNPPARKRAYTSEALRHAAGSMGPPPSPAQAQPSHGNTLRPRLCIDLRDVRQERDVRRRQAILGYGGKWYVFQCHRCHQHQEVLFFKTAEGARHHMVTRHARPNQHVDFLDIVDELGVEVMNCDGASAEENNLEAANMWSSNSVVQRSAEVRPEMHVAVQLPVRSATSIATQQRLVLQPPSTAQPEPAPSPTPRLQFPSAILLSEDEEEDPAAEQAIVLIKQETEEKKLSSLPMSASQEKSTGTSGCHTRSVEPAARAAESSGASQSAPLPALATESEALPVQRAAGTSESSDRVLETSTERRTETPNVAEQTPDLTPDTPESSELSEPPSLDDLESFEPQSVKQGGPAVVDDELEEGEIDESCIQVASCSPVAPEKAIASPDSGKKKKRRISAAGSASLSPAAGRKKLPSTPKSSQKKKKERLSFWSPPQESGPSAHDQFKTKACKKCPERFYFRAQLATHMKSEHPEVIIVE